MGAGTPLLRRIIAAVFVCALSLPLSGCGPLRTILEPPEKVVPTRVGGVRLGVLFDRAVPIRYRPKSEAVGHAEVASAVESGLVPFLTGERSDVWPRQRIIAALAIRGMTSHAEGTDLYGDMRLRRGPGSMYSGWAQPVRIRLLRRNGNLVVVGFDRPGDGSAWWHDMSHLFPTWIRPRLNDINDPLLVAELDRVDEEFVLKPVPAPAASSSRPGKRDDEHTERRVPPKDADRSRQRPPSKAGAEADTATRRLISER